MKWTLPVSAATAGRCLHAASLERTSRGSQHHWQGADTPEARQLDNQTETDILYPTAIHTLGGVLPLSTVIRPLT